MNRRIIAIAVLSVAGLAISLYLLTVHWGWWSAVCLGVGDCEYVNTSMYSELLGIPVALLGALAYLSFIGLAVLISRELFEQYSRLALFFTAVVGVLFSAYLTWVELFVLYEVCPWCVFSAIIVTLIAVLSFLELRAS